jgi:hypothetical protein
MRHYDFEAEEVKHVAKRFAGECGNHQMTVLHDDGLYRHLRFTAREGYSYWFDLITWPGSLTFNGDMGTWVFSRVEDMFDFFGGSYVNYDYWGEKVRAGQTKAYCEELFKQLVTEHAQELIDSGDQPAALMAAINEDIFEEDYSYETGARQLLDEFRFMPPAAEGIVSGLEFQFADTWEWGFRTYTVHYLYACHAIQWGIGQYRSAKSAALAEAVAA